MKSDLKIIFMGTPEFSVPTLEMLIENYNVIGVVTQPDKPFGRGYKLKSTPVKEVAQKNGINVYQPQKIKNNFEFIEKIRELNPDVIIVVAYGKILPKEILDLPRFGCINSHASLLPRHRGASPINFSIINGDTKTGITTMFMDEGLDTGDIIQKYEFKISDNMTAGELHDNLKKLSSCAIRDTLERLEKNEINREKQDDKFSTYAPMITKELGHIDFTKSSKEVFNLIRGLNPWPFAYCLYEEKKMKIYEAEIFDIDDEKYYGSECGEIVDIDKNNIIVKCGKGYISIKFFQFENKKPMSVKSFLNGNNIKKIKLK